MYLGYQILSLDTYQTILFAILAVIAIGIGITDGEVYNDDEEML